VKDRQLAAAVCFRFTPQLQVMLVKTTNQKRWTFPGGGIKANERAWQAAERESREEAGVCGQIDHRPVGKYRRGRKTSIAVRSYVLRVFDDQSCRAEAGRTPEWVSTSQVLEKLAVGREERPEELEGMLRVLRTAILRIQRA
jgi:8-oxo-dGTP pyrophosphatase MutT (NUDIX family)